MDHQEQIISKQAYVTCLWPWIS